MCFKGTGSETLSRNSDLRLRGAELNIYGPATMNEKCEKI